MKKAGMLSPTTDVTDLANRAFVHLKGISDDWLQSLEVDKVAGGQLPAGENFRVTAEHAARRGGYFEGGVVLFTGDKVKALAEKSKLQATSEQSNRTSVTRSQNLLAVPSRWRSLLRFTVSRRRKNRRAKRSCTLTS
jgi:hypothetical protein